MEIKMSTRSRDSRLGIKSRSLKQKMVIYCEGDVSEPEYLEKWRDDYCVDNGINKAKIKTYLIIKRSKSDSEPITIIDKMLKEIDSEDENYIVFDEDDRFSDDTQKQNLITVFSRADNNGIKYIFSNRSAEVWALLHFEYTSAPLPKESLLQKIKKHMPQYSEDNKRFDVISMRKNEARAIENAKRLREEQILNSPDEKYPRPWTNFDELIIAMQSFIDKVNKEY